jgi:uncharacterized protein (TIGR03437 family)
VTVDVNGNVTLGSGTAGNPVVLPPVIKAQSANNGSSGSSLTLTGDGFDPTAASYDPNNPNGNRVLIGGVAAVVTAATATTLIVTVPQGLTGSNLPITVVNNNQTSNQGSYSVNQAVTALNKPGGKPGDEVILTVSGFKPNETDLTVQFTGSANPLAPTDILEKTATTIRDYSHPQRWQWSAQSHLYHQYPDRDCHGAPKWGCTGQSIGPEWGQPARSHNRQL